MAGSKQSQRPRSAVHHPTAPGPSEPSPQTQGGSRARLTVAARVVLGLVLFGLTVGLTRLWVLRSVESDEAGEAVSLAVGPWGRLGRAEFYLEQPRDGFVPSACTTDDPVWHLPGARTPSQARALFEHAGLPAEMIATLLRATSCEAQQCSTVAPPEVVDGLSSEVRGRLYERLAQLSELNAHVAYPFMRPEGSDRWRGLTSLIDASLLARLTWHRGGHAQLSDLGPLCRAANTDEERLFVLETLSRMSAELAWIKVERGDDLDALVRYWSRGARTRELRPILEAVSRRPGGGQLDLLHLLPPFARRRLNTFPPPDSPPWDCFWTALNFFNVSSPPDVFVGGWDVLPVLERDYDRVPWASRTFGDLILFLDAGGQPIHAANHIAADMALSKNGYHPRRPWTLMSIDDLRDVYEDAVELRIYRLRELPPADWGG
jgi:hypothetical protein